jgi:hypothetical protein
MLELYVFGSLTAGDVDVGSDADILAIVGTGVDQEALPHDWTIYTEERILDLHGRGTLFAWHLFQDAVLIYPRETDGGLIRRLGRPTCYGGAIADIDARIELGGRALNEIVRGTPSMVFELGLMYLMARDVAMAASKPMLDRFVFSRYAPFAFEKHPFPLTRTEYRYLMGCRRASTRGVDEQHDAHQEATVLMKIGATVQWCHHIRRALDACEHS